VTMIKLKIARPISTFRLTCRLFRITEVGVKVMRYRDADVYTTAIAEEGVQELKGDNLTKEDQEKDSATNICDICSNSKMKFDVQEENTNVNQSSSCNDNNISKKKKLQFLNHSQGQHYNRHSSSESATMPARKPTDPPDMAFLQYCIRVVAQKVLSLSSISSCNWNRHRHYKAFFSSIRRMFI
jgi:hypothetical protein